MSGYGSILGWFQGEAKSVDWVKDRFNSHYAIDHWDGPTSSEGTFAQTFLDEFNLRDITMLGFTTREYQAMVRFWTACNGNDWLRSESELDIMIKWTEERRLHLNDNKLVDFILERRLESNAEDCQAPGDRTRREDIEDRNSHWEIWNVPIWKVHLDEMQEYEAALYMEVATDRRDWVRSWEELRVVVEAGKCTHLQSNCRAEELMRARSDWNDERDAENAEDSECTEYVEDECPTSSDNLHPSPITTNGGSQELHEGYSLRP